MKSIGLGLHTGMGARELIGWCKKGERAGFDSVWISEDPYFRDAFSLIGLAASATKKVSVATGIVNVYTRSPVYMAMAAATVDEVSRGRLILGVGRGVKSLIEDEMHIPYGSHIEHMEEYIQCTKKLLAGERVTYDGNEVKLTNAKLRFPPVRRKIPILLAAMGPKMLRLAFTQADGAILNSCTSVRHARYAAGILRSIRTGGTKKQLVCSLWTSIDEDVQRAYESVRRSVGFLLSIPTFGEVFLRRSGLPLDLLPELREAFRWEEKVGDPMWHLEHADAKRVKELVDDEIVDTLTVCGDAEVCRKRMREYYDAGVDTVVMNPMTQKTFAKALLLPFKGLQAS